ncbi:hypothetical protein AAC387_Pa01g3567 [Persea americana]|eukprot:TRINITY_DN3240_c0_g3_i1.p1 TRINITY_DN3240_c0_g3~~TRINITY_DN3240_c0_g3_i1.p1  ORF type:complete len:147 (-),score=32.43 TRINITY_DN3240_c0_g3_i1:1394-1834(-)
MRIRGPSSNPSSFCPHISPSSSSSLVSCSENYLLSDDEKTHCEGLDLLVKAAQHVAGNVLFDVPLIQRKVVSGGKNDFKLNKADGSEIENEESEEKKNVEIEVVSKPGRQKRQLSLPSKYHDSVLQPWKRQTRPKRSIAIERGSDE